MRNSRPNIVVVGGGSGSSMLLRGLRQHAVDLTAIVTTFDSGGSSGILREEFGFPPFGDLRKCLVALSDSGQATQSLSTASEFRFSSDSSLKGHSLGNLLLAALTEMHSDVEGAIAAMSRMLNIDGKVIPVALDSADLCAKLEDGSILRGESTIDLREAELPRIKDVFLDPGVDANPRTLEAIAEADAIVLGPGDLYTSIVPNLLVKQVSEAIAFSSARKIYVCNLMTKHGETDSFKASDFASEIVKYMGGQILDSVVVNSRPVPMDAQTKYATECAAPVELDEDEVSKYARSVVALPLSINEPKVRHDPDRLAEAVLAAVQIHQLHELVADSDFQDKDRVAII